MTLIESLALARELHGKQVDKAGEPYIWHPVRVMLRLPSDASEIAKIAALLHDVIEDCGVTEAQLVDRGVPAGAARMVSDLSRPEGMTYAEFIQRIASVGGNVAKIKRADIGDNLDLGRLAVLALKAPAKAAALAARYRQALHVLSTTSRVRIL